MKIALIGAGNMASGFAHRIARTKNALMIRGRDATKASNLARSTGAQIGDRVAADADIIIVATAYSDTIKALQQIGDLSGKVIVDITNPLSADYSGLTIGLNTSAAEEIQKAFPQAKVVKGFNTVFAQVLADDHEIAGTRVPVYVAGDDDIAKETVKKFAADIGFKAVDAGPLKNARLLEPLAALNVYFGYGAGHGTAIAPAWLGLGNGV
jgi:predicted dinucleotide-binding enzyme